MVLGVIASHLCCATDRFLGWVRSQPGAVGALDCSLFGAEAAQDLVERFVQWCQHERQLSMGTIGTYLNSILSCINFAHASRICECEDSFLQAVCNLRMQAEAQSREDRKWKRPHPAWISWGECSLLHSSFPLCEKMLTVAAFTEEAQETRRAALQRQDDADADKFTYEERVELAEDVLIVCFHTVAPPDR